MVAGCGDLYFEIRLSPWDFVAAQLILTEAGGYIGTIGFDTLVYNRPLPYHCGEYKRKLCVYDAKGFASSPKD